MQKNIELHAIFRGRVQGVGFRWAVQEYAEKKGLEGTVKNLSNGTVEVFLQGSKEQLEDFIQIISSSSDAAHIQSIEKEYRESSTSFHGFHILF